MNLVKRSLLFFAIVLSAAAGHAQTAEAIIAKHIEAIGGKDKLKGINSVRMENTMQVMGNEAPGSTQIVNGKGFRSEVDYNGQQIVQVYTDKGGWAMNPMTGSADPQAINDEQYKAAADQIYIVPFLNYSDRGTKAELLGQEKVGTVNAFKIKLTSKENQATTYYIDPATYYILQEVRSGEMMGQQLDVTTAYSDYKKTDYGWVVPQKMDIDFGGQFAITAVTSKVEVNPTIDTAVFEMKK